MALEPQRSLFVAPWVKPQDVAGTESSWVFWGHRSDAAQPGQAP